MKKRIISVLLTAIMVCGVISPVYSGADSPVTEATFSAEPKDMTPAEQEYSPGLGDRMDSITYNIDFGITVGPTVPESGYPVVTTYEQALAIQRKIANLTNGAHLVAHAIGQDALRWGTAPYVFEDTSYPMGDGTPGSGYRKYREYVEASFANNTDVVQILEPLLAGSMRDDYAPDEEIIPLSCYTLDERGQKKVGWSANGRDWYLLSLYNLYNTGYAQRAWQRMVDNWGFRTYVYYDAMIPVPEGLYNNPNRTTRYGGVITNTEMEWEAVQRETKYSWENYAISSGQEYLYPPYKGLSCYYTLPYGIMTDEDYLNTWQNSMMISTRSDPVMNLVWGSEVNDHDEAFHFDGNTQPGSDFISRLMEHNFQYLYMMERKPLSYTNNKDIHQVVFSGDLVSTYNKKTENYTLVENGDFIIADGYDRFIPQVGAGCKIFAYSRNNKMRTWKLPDTWEGITEVDIYILSASSPPKNYVRHTVTDGTVSFMMYAGTPYLLVPKGDAPTPITANFNDLAAGDVFEQYQALGFLSPEDPTFKVYGANARGGFATPSVYADSAAASEVASLSMSTGAILHSMKIGNRGGAGRVVLHSSNPLNEDVMITLPATDQVYKFNTEWKYGEIGDVSVLIENAEGVSNVLFDAIMYSPTSAAARCVSGMHEYEHRHFDAICGADGRDSDVCRYCGKEINLTVIPKIEGEHLFTDEEVLLTATAFNTGLSAMTCLKCGYSVETEIPKTFFAGNHVFHSDFGYNYMQTEELSPYTKSNGAVIFDFVPLDVTKRTDPSGPCYFGVWFGDGYSVCAGYDFQAQRFVIGENSMQFNSSMSAPLASKTYTWTKTLNGKYPMHRFGFSLVGNTATIYIDGEKMLSYSDPSFESSDDILLMYSKGEAVIDNIIISDSGYDDAVAGENTVCFDFEKGADSLEGWALAGFITTDIREFDLSPYVPENHVHKNVLLASHEATYTHGSYDEYECSLCHERTVVDTGAPVTGDVLVHVSAVEPGCTESGNIEYWYDRELRRFTDSEGTSEITPESIIVPALGHILVRHPAVTASATEEGFVEYWSCSRCQRNYADAQAETEISLIKTNAVREVENAIAAIGTVKYREETPISTSGILGTFSQGNGYSVLDVGNPGSKLNADYTVEMMIRITDVDYEAEVAGSSGAFFGCGCENFTVGYDFETEKWGVSPIGGLFASYAFHPSEAGPECVLDDGYFHTVKIECTTEAIRVFVDDSCVLNATSLAREDNRYCIFYPRFCTVEFASYAFMYDGEWIDDHLKGRSILSASTWGSKDSAYGKRVISFSGNTLADSLHSIEYAENLYESLSPNEKLLVSDYAELVRARKTYNLLEKGLLTKGDVNMDGKVNARDVVTVMRYITGWNDTSFSFDLADFDENGRINAKDVVSIMRFIVSQ